MWSRSQPDLYEVLKQDKPERRKVEWQVPGAGGSENAESAFNADGLSTWGDEKVLEMDGGDGHPMCTLKMVKMVILMLCILCHNYKEREQTFE